MLAHGPNFIGRDRPYWSITKERLNLSPHVAIFPHHGVRQLHGLAVAEKPFHGFPRRLNDGNAIHFPVPDELIRRFSIPEVQGLSKFFAMQCSLNRYGASARTVLAPFRRMLAGSQVAAKNRKHEASVK
jgi:hypothetical protein